MTAVKYPFLCTYVKKNTASVNYVAVIDES